jgi:hypothetical protein
MSSRRRFILHLSSFILLFAALLIAAVAATTVIPVETPAPTRWAPPVVFTPTTTATPAPGWWLDQPTPFPLLAPRPAGWKPSTPTLGG